MDNNSDERFFLGKDVKCIAFSPTGIGNAVGFDGQIYGVNLDYSSKNMVLDYISRKYIENKSFTRVCLNGVFKKEFGNLGDIPIEKKQEYFSLIVKKIISADKKLDELHLPNARF